MAVSAILDLAASSYPKLPVIPIYESFQQAAQKLYKSFEIQDGGSCHLGFRQNVISGATGKLYVMTSTLPSNMVEIG